MHEIITSARQNAVRSVDFSRVQMYWKIGRRIQEEQKGKERADYGAYYLYFSGGNCCGWDYGYRYRGRSVRPVSE